MAKYRVNLMAAVSVSVEVEAEDRHQALELAYEQDLPGLNISNGDMDMEEWVTFSEFLPDIYKPEDDCTLID